MKRCWYPLTSSSIRIAAGVTVLSAALAAGAQPSSPGAQPPAVQLPNQQAYPAILPSADGVRQFPAWASRATLVVTQPPLLTLNGREARLSPGGRIFSEQNTIVLSSTLVGQELVVNFTLWPDGLVRDAWILSEAERKRPMADGSDRQGNFISGAEEAALELIRRAREQRSGGGVR
jgi:hypothetical protein